MQLTIENTYPWFTELYLKYRPYDVDHIVYDIDVGEPKDYNIIIKAAKIKENMIVGDPATMLLSKEWLIENYPK